MKIFQQYEADIYRMAFVYLKNQEDALDVVQEVAYQSFKKIHTLNKPEYIKAWLMKITINCAINIIRNNKKVIQLVPEFEEFIGSDEKDIPLNLSLQDLIDKLEDEEKSIVLLKFYHDFTFVEISGMLEIPLGTVKSRLYRAISKLRQEVKEGKFYE